jgi:hypothetical protein
MIYCSMYKINVDNEECKMCEHYTLTDILQRNIVGYECSYDVKNKMIIWCGLYNINVDIGYNCKNKCVLWKKGTCQHSTWYPALLKQCKYYLIAKDGVCGAGSEVGSEHPCTEEDEKKCQWAIEEKQNESRKK